MDSSQLKIRHERSAKEYPHLSLSEGEFVELEFRRAAICYVLIWIVAIIAAALLSVVLAIFNFTPSGAVVAAEEAVKGFINIVAVVLYGFFILGALVTTKVFSGNRLYVTNQRAIEYEMPSLFSTSVNIIELTRIEDVSFRQNGIIAHTFGIGTIRMSTVGDETTYTFKDVYKPTAGEIKSLTDLVANAKRRKHEEENAE